MTQLARTFKPMKSLELYLNFDLKTTNQTVRN